MKGQTSVVKPAARGASSCFIAHILAAPAGRQPRIPTNLSLLPYPPAPPLSAASLLSFVLATLVPPYHPPPSFCFFSPSPSSFSSPFSPPPHTHPHSPCYFLPSSSACSFPCPCCSCCFCSSFPSSVWPGLPWIGFPPSSAL